MSVISIIIMILLLGVLILVHEAGHFLAAKAFKMKVSKFGFGLPIGPTLWEKQVGDLKILVHAFLFGGYVAFPDDDKDIDLPADSPDRFLNRPVYQRLIVISAGVTANVIIAFVFVLMTALLWGHMPSGKYDVYVDQIMTEKNVSLADSGLQPGDKIIKINGSNIESSYALSVYAKLSKKNDGKVSTEFVEKNYENLKKLNPAYKRDETIPKDVTVWLPKQSDEPKLVLSDKVLKGYTRHKDKQILLNEDQKKLRDELLGKSYLVSDGKLTLNNIAYALSDSAKPLDMIVWRDGKQIKINTIYSCEDGLIGIKMDVREIVIPTKGLGSAVTTSCKYLYDQTYMLLFGLWQILSGKIPLKDLHGIIAITKVGGDIINNSGIFSGLLLTAIISLDLAIVNFLPIPALDGGHVMFLIIEKIQRKPVDEKTVDKVGTAGFIFLIFLMILVCFNDVIALLTKQL